MHVLPEVVDVMVGVVLSGLVWLSSGVLPWGSVVSMHVDSVTVTLAIMQGISIFNELLILGCVRTCINRGC